MIVVVFDEEVGDLACAAARDYGEGQTEDQEAGEQQREAGHVFEAAVGHPQEGQGALHSVRHPPHPTHVLALGEAHHMHRREEVINAIAE